MSIRRLAPPPHGSGTATQRRYRRFVLQLGFRFDVDAVVVAGVAHRNDCDHISDASGDDAIGILAGGVHRRVLPAGVSEVLAAVRVAAGGPPRRRAR